jgi:hypothetical protein
VVFFTQIACPKESRLLDPLPSQNQLLLTVALLLIVSCSISCANAGSQSPAPAPPVISVSVDPQNPSIQINQTQPFTATVANDTQNKGVTWSLTCIGACGTLSSTTANPVTYTAPAAVAGSSVIITATSNGDNSKSGTSTITVTTIPVISVSVAPQNPSVSVSQTQSFTATVTNDTQNKGVTWSLSGTGCTGAACGALSSTTANPVTYTAPAAVPGSTVTITATSNTDNTKNGTSIITVTPAATGFAGVTTWHNDNSRSGLNTTETALTLANVNTTKFGKLFSCTVEADVYAQPLYVPNVAIASKGTHNVIFVATEKDTLYAFDADTNANPCLPLWQVTLLGSGETALDTTSGDGCVDAVSPDIGITGTPVIDLSTKTLYVVTTSKISGSAYFQRLHALDVTTGAEKFGGPVPIQATISGTSFDPAIHLQRPGLLLQGGAVYIAWASYCDNGPYHGWVLGYNASSLLQVSKFNDTPNGTLGGIWMSGAGPASDESGNVYLITGNGTFDANAGGTDFGDTFLKLTGSLSVVDWFTPFNEDLLNTGDQDVGGGGSVLLLDNPGGPNAHLLIGGGKEGKLYLVNRDGMGHFNTGSDSQIVQSFSPTGHGIFATPVFWQNKLYLAPSTSPMSQFVFDATTGKFNTIAAFQSAATFSFPGATPSLSANGTANVILWAIERPSGGGTAVLHAYDASNLSELWNSSMAAGGRDQAGSAVKFTVPTIAHGKVYIGTHGELDVFGLLP